MKLSDAIVLGMMNVVPGRGPFKNRPAHTRCVVEATLEAVGLPAQINAGGEWCTNYGGIELVWPWTKQIVAHPRMPDFYAPVSMLLWSLFDGLTDRGLTSKEIADWITTIEPQDPAQDSVQEKEGCHV